MQWLQSNWIWILLVVGFVAMHMFGHGGHQHGHSRRNGDGWRDPNSTDDTTAEAEVQRTRLSSNPSGTAGLNEPAQGGASTHAGHAASPTSAEGNRHRHGC